MYFNYIKIKRIILYLNNYLIMKCLYLSIKIDDIYLQK